MAVELRTAGSAGCAAIGACARGPGSGFLPMLSGGGPPSSKTKLLLVMFWGGG